MAFADFSADQEERQPPHGLPDMHANDEQGASRVHGSAAGYRMRLALIVSASLTLWSAIFEAARLIFA